MRLDGRREHLDRRFGVQRVHAARDHVRHVRPDERHPQQLAVAAFADRLHEPRGLAVDQRTGVGGEREATDGDLLVAVRLASLHLREADRGDLDPQRLGEVERRIEAVLGCARKFRSTPDELPALLEGWQARLALLGESADIAALEARVAKARQEYEALAKELSKRRRKAADALGREVSRVMQQLALGGGRFEIGLLAIDDGSAQGAEHVEFRIAGLAGSEPRALAKVASGGELSRISLAIQVVTSQAASVPTLIFDEVDVGIGGGVAEVVGRLLRELGSERQVLCVTHLPQVAARANWQWQVVKSTQGGQLRSRVVALDDAARVEEIARMLGGVEITAITRQHAREMLGAS